MGKRILLTGANGFLGSQIVEELIVAGHTVVGIRRESSDLWRCTAFIDRIVWVNIEHPNWEQEIIELSPEVFIHSAWCGVGANDRNNWEEQTKNIGLTIRFLEIARLVRAQKFIGFGSQAEYGLFSGTINEDHDINPTTAYGLSKNLVAQTIKCFSEQNDMDWYWLRLFSFFGEKEDDNWFIPTVIKNIRDNKPMDMTPGLQRYAYMYVKDLARIVVKIVESSMKSDVYNVSSSQSIELKRIVEKIIEIIKPSNPKINFGAIPYRKNQPMIIQGDTEKLRNELGDFIESDFDLNLKTVVNFVLNK